MKKILLFLAVSISAVIAQSPKSTFTVGAYYTQDSYSSNNSSKSYSLYGVIDINMLDRIVLGYDNLRINIPDSNWIYDQNFFVISGMKNLYPFYLKFDYAYAGGKYGEKFGQNYYYGTVLDATQVIHASLLYNFNLFFIGLGSSYTTGTGYYDLSTRYIEGKLIWHPSIYFNLSLMPAYVTTDDDRNEFSLGAEMFFHRSPL